MSTVDILRKGKAVLLERGWTQGAYVNGSNGPCCVLGACIIGAGLSMADFACSVEACSVEREVKRALREGNNFDFIFSAIRWNDEPGRTQDEVIAALDKAIAYRAGLDELP